MLKTILNFKGVEVLSANEQKNTIGGSERCIVAWSPFPYYGPCIVEGPILPIEPICRITVDGVVCE